MARRFLWIFILALWLEVLGVAIADHCDCRCPSSNARQPDDRMPIGCDGWSGSRTIGCGDIWRQLVWKTRKDSLARSTIKEALEIVHEQLPSGAPADDPIAILIIGDAFYKRLPKIPEPISSDLPFSTQLRHLTEMKESIGNATCLVREILRDSNRADTIRSRVPHQYYEALEFALVHVYCPLDRLLRFLITSTPDENGLEINDRTAGDDRRESSWSWNPPSLTHSLLMERTVLMRLDNLYDRVATNVNRLRGSIVCNREEK